jgi:hypothetical protein
MCDYYGHCHSLSHMAGEDLQIKRYHQKVRSSEMKQMDWQFSEAVKLPQTDVMILTQQQQSPSHLGSERKLTFVYVIGAHQSQNEPLQNNH